MSTPFNAKSDSFSRFCRLLDLHEGLLNINVIITAYFFISLETIPHLSDVFHIRGNT